MVSPDSPKISRSIFCVGDDGLLCPFSHNLKFTVNVSYHTVLGCARQDEQGSYTVPGLKKRTSIKPFSFQTYRFEVIFWRIWQATEGLDVVIVSHDERLYLFVPPDGIHCAHVQQRTEDTFSSRLENQRHTNMPRTWKPQLILFSNYIGWAIKYCPII